MSEEKLKQEIEALDQAIARGDAKLIPVYEKLKAKKLKELGVDIVESADEKAEETLVESEAIVEPTPEEAPDTVVEELSGDMSSEPSVEPVVPKNKGGRPKGSRNKKTI